MPYARSAQSHSRTSLRDASLKSFWLDSPFTPAVTDPLVGTESAQLVVVGAGYTGLWTALLAKEAEPGRDVLVLEADVVGGAASGRNGGFVDASLTHGLANGLQRFSGELAELVRLGQANLEGLASTLDRYGIDADFRRCGGATVATDDYQVADLKQLAVAGVNYGVQLEYLDREQILAHIRSPLLRGALVDKRGVALVDPARLAWGLRRVCIEKGVRVHENSAVTNISADGAAMKVTTVRGSVACSKVALATNAFPPLLKRLRPYLVPVYDYVLITEPLSSGQWDEIGWPNRQGLSDAGNQFHYFRPTADGRILWGGYDAVYHWNNGLNPRFDLRPESFALLAEHFFQFFPQLSDIRFSHAWGGAIDMCSRFSAFWGTARQGRVAYVAGYTGLGVAASRFGAATMLDLLDGRNTERTALEMVQTKPRPLPPEPFRSVGVGLTRWSLDRADRNLGRRNLWLRSLDRAGLGFDS